jgi:hypothetical protein
MSELDRIRKELTGVWHDDPALPLCLKILDFVANAKYREDEVLTYRTLARAAGRDHVDEELLKAVTILVTSTARVLDANAYFVDEYEHQHSLSRAEVEAAISEGYLIHPETGDKVRNFEARVIPYFTKSDRLRQNRVHER